MACLIILFNWFSLGVSGLIVAIWNASYMIIPVIQKEFILDWTPYYV